MRNSYKWGCSERGCMDRQQWIAIFFVVLMIGSSVVYAGASLF
ncbi:hypothetical protein [Haloprofundus halobius]|nr:hypothetical protein [Haloprofundus halobius]